MWHRIRMAGGGLEAGSEQDEYLRKMSAWVLDRAVQLSRQGVPLKKNHAEVYTKWDGDDRVWHLNDTGLQVYQAVGGTRKVEGTAENVPPAEWQALLFSTAVFKMK
jgi:hypothetical protein